jgi:hypothetical protein
MSIEISFTSQVFNCSPTHEMVFDEIPVSASVIQLQLLRSLRAEAEYHK